MLRTNAGEVCLASTNDESDMARPEKFTGCKPLNGPFKTLVLHS